MAAAFGWACIYGFFVDELVLALAFGSSSAAFLIWQGSRQSKVAAFSITLAFVIGNLVQMGVFTLLYLRFTELPSAGRYPALTIWLLSGLCWAAVVGCLVIDGFLPRPNYRGHTRDDPPQYAILFVTGGLFFAASLGLLATGFLDSRWEHAAPGFGLSYFLNGIRTTCFVFFFILGTHMRGPLLAPRNLTVVGLVALPALGSGLSGGRGYSVMMVLLMLVGAGTAGMPRRQMIRLASGAAVLGVIFFSVVGLARSDRAFVRGSVGDRIEAIQGVTTELGDTEGSRTAFEEFVHRGFREEAQIVIDETKMSGRRAGFEHFERLKHLFVPKVLAPNKERLTDGSDILARDYGVHITELHHIPITVVADAYRRGGEKWVFVVGFLVGALMRLLVQFVSVLVAKEVALACLVLLSMLALSSAGSSVLGLFVVFMYKPAKSVILFGGLALMIRAIRMLVARSSTGLQIERDPPRTT